MCLCVQIVTLDHDRCLPLYRHVWDLVAEHSPTVESLQLHYGFADIASMVVDTVQARH